MKRLFRNRDIKVIILEVFLIALGLVGLTLGVKYIMNSINVNVDTSKLAIDSMNANVSNGTLTPINDSSVNINTTSNVLRITFDVKGASTNTGSNIIYDVLLNLTADCSLKNESVKWNLYKNNNLLTSGTTSPKYDKDVLKGKIMLTDIQQDLVSYSKTADKYVFILWMSESCNEEDITKCDISKGLTSDSGGKSISGNIDIRLNSGKKKENKRESSDIENTCSILGGNGAEAVKLADDRTNGDSGSGVYKVTHSAIPASSSATGSEIPAVTDYRYYGPSPNNYVCLDMEGQSTCPDKHLYRIIGSIYEENAGKNLIKVIKATPLTDGTTSKFSWDHKVNNGSGSNDNIWATITSGNYSNSLTSGSSLMTLLNSGAWWNGTSGSYYNNSTTATTVNFINYKLSDKAKNYITTSRYYLGGYNDYSPLTNAMYGYERGTLRYNKDRPLYWDGMVGLMYPSDFGYAAGNTCVTGTYLYSYDEGCYKKDWLTDISYWQWLMSPYSGHSDRSFLLHSSGYVYYDNFYGYTSGTGSVRPVFFLNSSASISEGEGTSAAPYILA